MVALNKVDRFDLSDPHQAQHVAAVQAEYPDCGRHQRADRAGDRHLLQAIDKALQHHMAAVDVLIPYQRGELVSLMHEHGVVEHEEHTEHGTHLQGRLPVELAGRYAHYWVQETVE